SRQRLDVLRLIELWCVRIGQRPEGGKALARPLDALARGLLESFGKLSAAGAQKPDLLQRGVLFETARLVAYLRLPEAPQAIGRALAATSDPQLQMHYALCLRYADTAWPGELKQSLLAWY